MDTVICRWNNCLWWRESNIFLLLHSREVNLLMDNKNLAQLLNIIIQIARLSLNHLNLQFRPHSILNRSTPGFYRTFLKLVSLNLREIIYIWVSEKLSMFEFQFQENYLLYIYISFVFWKHKVLLPKSC